MNLNPLLFIPSLLTLFKKKKYKLYIMINNSYFLACEGSYRSCKQTLKEYQKNFIIKKFLILPASGKDPNELYK